MINFSNKYGSAQLLPVTVYMPVSQISAVKLPIINECLLSIDDAESLTLITDNKGVQVSFPYLLENDHPKRLTSYVIHHQSANVACVCKVIINSSEIESGLAPHKEIDRIYQNSNEKLA